MEAENRPAVWMPFTVTLTRPEASHIWKPTISVTKIIPSFWERSRRMDVTRVPDAWTMTSICLPATALIISRI